eukprot:gb/GEZN01012993.1/.p1 GENE.gb/GEZN01012993.1/~~gb/GEZN01012993.1/.p1  ORF type:complete len:332 (-),score=4.66 gb/GEZN01012993.1/:46-951(-)
MSYAAPIFHHGTACTELQIANITAQHPIKHSKCPPRIFMSVFLNASRYRSTANVISIGCNKGEDFIATLEAFSGNKSFDVKSYGANLPRRVCGGKAESFMLPDQALRPVRGICVEPLPANVRLLTRKFGEHKFGLPAVKLIPHAISNEPGVGKFPDGAEGTEALGFANGGSFPVNISTIDDIISLEDFDIVDFLTIDTEGWDALAITGMIRSLIKPLVRLFEFEYHAKGYWRKADLNRVICFLDEMGFDCYIQGNAGQLWRLTNCWSDQYHKEKKWSNVVCVNRAEITTHAWMQNLASKFM